MLKIAKLLGIGKEGASNGGLINLISEKTGKISFRRSVPILLLTGIVIPNMAINGLTWMNITVIAISAAIYVLPQIINAD